MTWLAAQPKPPKPSWLAAQPKPPPVTPPNQVFDYQQKNDNRWQIKKITSEGACQGLSIFWVINRANHVDYLTWLGPPKAASSKGKDPANFGKELEDVIRVMEQQDKLLRLNNPNFRSMNMHWARDRIAAVEGGGGTTQLKPNQDLALMQGATPMQIAAEVTRIDGLVFFGVLKIGWGGHALAAAVQQPAIAFFDPNYGEYTFVDLQSFHTWFDQVLCNNYYGFNMFDKAEIQHFV